MTGQAEALDALKEELRSLDRADDLASIETLVGGLMSDVSLVSYTDGRRLVVKMLHDGPQNIYQLESEGLAALRATQTVEVPDVLDATERALLLEALPPLSEDPAAWERFAHDLAALYQSTEHDRFGWHHDGYSGMLRQRNPWTDDGHTFFAEHRLLRYLEEPITQQTLEPADCRAVERLCDRLPEVVPEMPPVLTHGDLWAANMVGGRDGSLALIDPAVSYTWAEVDLAMLYCCAPPPAAERFFDVYQELNPSPEGWVERMPFLYLREVLNWISHIGVLPLPDPAPVVAQLRATLAPFYPAPRKR
jgi:fructosamine-3-kinase